MSASDPKRKSSTIICYYAQARPPSVLRLIIINHVLTPTIVEMNSLRTADTGPA
jgi:hypothetical protein